MAGSVLHGGGSRQGTFHAGGEHRPGVVAFLNAALDYVSRFQKHADATPNEWKEVREIVEEAILAENARLDWKNFVLNLMYGNVAMRSSKAEEEILCSAAVTLGAKLPQHCASYRTEV